MFRTIDIQRQSVQGDGIQVVLIGFEAVSFIHSRLLQAQAAQGMSGFLGVGSVNAGCIVTGTVGCSSDLSVMAEQHAFEVLFQLLAGCTGLQSGGFGAVGCRQPQAYEQAAAEQ
ncbi:MAG: hypothetical protein R3E95_17345 [Thiolinea sp.]